MGQDHSLAMNPRTAGRSTRPMVSTPKLLLDVLVHRITCRWAFESLLENADVALRVSLERPSSRARCFVRLRRHGRPWAHACIGHSLPYPGPQRFGAHSELARDVHEDRSIKRVIRPHRCPRPRWSFPELGVYAIATVPTFTGENFCKEPRTNQAPKSSFRYARMNEEMETVHRSLRRV